MHNCANFEQKSKGSVLDSSNSGWASPSQVGGQALSRKTSTSSDDSKACIKSIGDVMSLRPEAGACPKLTSHHVACCQVDFFVDRSFFPQPPSHLLFALASPRSVLNAITTLFHCPCSCITSNVC